MRKPDFCICGNKGADQLINAFVFASQIVQSLYFLNPKFQVSSYLLWLYTARFVYDMVENPEDMFSHDTANIFPLHSGDT